MTPEETLDKIAEDCRGDRGLHIFELEKAYRAAVEARDQEWVDGLCEASPEFRRYLELVGWGTPHAGALAACSAVQKAENEAIERMAVDESVRADRNACCYVTLTNFALAICARRAGPKARSDSQEEGEEGK